MGLYLEVPELNNKADQIIGLMDADVAGDKLWPPPPLRILVCAIVGAPGFEDTAHICADYSEFQHFNWVGDARYKTWLWVPMGRVLEQHPTLDISQASPETSTKQKHTSSSARGWTG